MASTSSSAPTPSDFQEIIEAAGGSAPTIKPSDATVDSTIVLGTELDEDLCKRLGKAGFEIQSGEFVLAVILHQEVDHKRYTL